MALVVTTLASAILAIAEDKGTNFTTNKEAADALAAAIDAYIKSGEVIVVGGGSYSGTVAKML